MKVNEVRRLLVLMLDPVDGRDLRVDYSPPDSSREPRYPEHRVLGLSEWGQHDKEDVRNAALDKLSEFLGEDL